MKILLVRLRLIGDAVFTTPVVHALRRRFPDAHISYLVEPAAAPVLRGNPHLSELIVVPRRPGIGRLVDDVRVVRRLRRERFDVAIDMHGGPRAAWLTLASGAPMRVGYTIAGRTWMYTHVIPRSPDLTPRHSVQNQADLLAPFGVDGCDPAREPMEMAEDPDARMRIDAWLRAQGADAGDPIVMMHVSAGNPFRRWPADSFAAVAAALVRGDARRRVIVFSGASERSAADAVAAAAQRLVGPGAARITAGDYQIGELRALSARAAVYIGGDSGPLHIAATTRTPIVELLGPTLPERSRPWRDPRWFTEIVDAGALPCRPCHQRQCEPGDFRCLTSIEPQRVIDAAERAIAHWTTTTAREELTKA